jgi:hypothetical protein
MNLAERKNKIAAQTYKIFAAQISKFVANV